MRNDGHQEETKGRKYHREVQECKTEVVWTREDLYESKNTSEERLQVKDKRKTETKMDGLC